MTDEYVLQHYGVKGMKWGVRRYQDSNGKYTKLGWERYARAREQYKKAKGFGNKMLKANQLEDAKAHLKRTVAADRGKALSERGISTSLANERLKKSVYRTVGMAVVGNVLTAGLLNAGAGKAAVVVGLANQGALITNAMLYSKDYKNVKDLKAYRDMKRKYGD